jgi:hypothetical protein
MCAHSLCGPEAGRGCSGTAAARDQVSSLHREGAADCARTYLPVSFGFSQLTAVRETPRCSMQNAKALFWLGKIEKMQYNEPVVAYLNKNKLRSIIEAQLVGPPGNLGPAERELIDDLIRLFDATLDQFDKRVDREIRQTLDILALTVISRVRSYIRPNVFT